MPASLLALLLVAGISPRDEILRYVPDDSAYCAVFTGLPAAAERLRESPFAALLTKTLAKGAPGVKELDELQKIGDYVREVLKIDLKDLADVVPGEAFAFAYRPGPPGKADREQALFLLRSKDGKALARLVNTLNAFQTARGELESRDDAEHKGVKYVRRHEKAGKNFYLLSGPVLLFTAQEDMLKRAIEQSQALAKDATPGVAKRLAALGLDKAEAAVVLNPRAFDGHMDGASKEAKTLSAYWMALDGAGLGLTLGRDAGLTFAVAGRPAKLPPAGRKFLEGVARASSLWGAFPEKPMLAVAGRLDLAALYAAVGEFMPDANREALEKELDRWVGSVAGKNVVKDLLPSLGPDWGFCLLMPATGSKEAQPRLLAAVKVAASEEAAVRRLMESWMLMAVLGHNKQNPDHVARIGTRGDGAGQIQCMEGAKGLPFGVVPSWALRAGHLLAGTSPDALAAFKLGRPPAEGVPLLRASASAWRGFVKGQRGPLAAAMTEREGIKKAEAEARLDAVDSFLSLIDSVELSRHEDRSRVAFTLRVRFAAPLRKD